MYQISIGKTGIHTRGDLMRKTDSAWVVVDDDVLNGEGLELLPGSYLYKFYSVGHGDFEMLVREVGGPVVSGPEAHTAPSPRDVFEFQVR